MQAEKRQFRDNQKVIGDLEKIISVHLQKVAAVNETQISGKQAKANLVCLFVCLFAMLLWHAGPQFPNQGLNLALSSESVECPVKGDLEYIFQGLSENGNLWDITVF